jgi:hypothetical protein
VPQLSPLPRRGRTVSRKRNGSVLHRFPSALPNGSLCVALPVRACLCLSDGSLPYAGACERAARRRRKIRTASSTASTTARTALTTWWTSCAGRRTSCSTPPRSLGAAALHPAQDARADDGRCSIAYLTDARRQFWLRSKLAETSAHVVRCPGATAWLRVNKAALQQSQANRFRFLPLPFQKCTPEVRSSARALSIAARLSRPCPASQAFLWAYQPPAPGVPPLTTAGSAPKQHAAGFQQDGVLFVHSASQYEGGASPLSLEWKDRFSTRFLIESEDGVTLPNATMAVLRVDRATGALSGGRAHRPPRVGALSLRPSACSNARRDPGARSGGLLPRGATVGFRCLAFCWLLGLT